MIKTHKGFQKKASDSVKMMWRGTAINPEYKKPISEWKHFTAFEGFSTESEISEKDLDTAMEWLGYAMLQGFPKYDCFVECSIDEVNNLYVEVTSFDEKYSYKRMFEPAGGYAAA